MSLQTSITTVHCLIILLEQKNGDDWHSIDWYKGCFITFLLRFSVCLKGKLIQVKMSLCKLMDLDHFTIAQKYQF